MQSEILSLKIYLYNSYGYLTKYREIAILLFIDFRVIGSSKKIIYRNFIKIGDIYQDADCLKEANEAANRLNMDARKQIMDDLYQNGANDIFLFLDAYSTI